MIYLIEQQISLDTASTKRTNKLKEYRKDFLDKRELMHMLVDSIYQIDKEVKTMHF